MDSYEKTMVMSEIELMKVLDHPNIVTFYEVYEEKSAYYIVLELCQGGDLFDLMQSKNKLGEAEIKTYIWQMLLAVNYLHNKSIAHLDLKPENFMFPSKGSRNLKVIDFGLAKAFIPN